MQIEKLREEIDGIDVEICRLFQKRMEIVDSIGEYKLSNQEPVNNSKREKEVLRHISKSLPPHLEDYGRSLYRSIFDISKAYEAIHKVKESPLYHKLSQLMEARPTEFPARATVACHGREGAYSEMAAEHLFELPEIMFSKNYEGVFRMVRDGLCEFGILPMENSIAGSVNEIYDLLLKYGLHVVRSTRIKIDHLLLGAKGTALQEIKVIYSHPQAIIQCSNFLSTLKDVQIVPCENTAIAAATAVAERGAASISSRSCAELYNMEILAEKFQNFDNIHTRFVCVTKEPRIYPAADRTSIMMILPDTPGKLFAILSRFNAVGANVIKIESRPLPDRPAEMAVYLDVEMSIYNPRFAQLISELDHCGEQFKYLGTYSEIK